MIRRPPRSTQSRSSAASDVYKRQLIKHVRIRESINFEFRAEAFNLTNTPYFSFPTVTVTTPATVGRSLSTGTFARIVQLGAKINF